MKFFFPDAADLVDPSFDFVAETRSESRVRQRDDLYAHEVFDSPPCDGVLVSKAIVDGRGQTSRYTMAQRHRLLRSGVRDYFRLDAVRSSPPLATMGDCGAFSYVADPSPPFTVEEVLDFYEQCGFDLAVSVDHVILGYDESLDEGLPGLNPPPSDWTNRRELTIDLAREFIALSKSRRVRFHPIGVAQGWSPSSYAKSVQELQQLGYTYIAIGGIVPLKTHEILASLGAIAEVRRPDTRLHLFGVTRTDEVVRFANFGVASFDSTSPLRQAFKDDKDNYYTLDSTYPAIRVPQVDGNPRLKRRLAAGEIDPVRTARLEKVVLSRLCAFDREECTTDDVIPPLMEYEQLLENGRSRETEYRNVLNRRPWRDCSCRICKDIGIHVMLFRGAERNRRRGFHNVYVSYQRLHRSLQFTEMNRGYVREQ